MHETQFAFALGLQHFKYNTITATDSEFKEALQARINRQFQNGDRGYFQTVISQNQINNPTFPSRGYQWSLITKTAFSPLRLEGADFRFFKTEADISWMTPIINEFDLVLYLHGHMGFIYPFNNGNVPYRELFQETRTLQPPAPRRSRR